MSDRLPHEVFISHSHADHAFCSSIGAILVRHGIAVWYSEMNIVGGQQWHDEIGDALHRCDWFVLVLSPDSVESMWVKRELYFALERARFRKRIIPLNYRPCNMHRLSWTLSSFQFVDFTLSFDKGCVDLLRVWGLDYKA